MREEYNKKKKDEFLEKLNALNPRDLLFYKENYPLAVELSSFTSFYRKWAELDICQTGELPLQGTDLDDVKHFPFPYLAPLTHHIGDDYVLGKTMFGRMLLDANKFVKTWDLFYPPTGQIELHSKRLRNEIMLLTSMEHPCLPKLVGYSIDKQFAVVYQREGCLTLQDILSCPDFTWDERMEVAYQIATLMEYFHDNGKTIGSIDPQNILVDSNFKIKLCEFGLCGTIDALTPRKADSGLVASDAWWITGGIYSFQVPELMIHQAQNPIKAVEWTAKCDIYCFGCLLLELISIEHEHTLESRYNILKSWAKRQLEKKSVKNLVDKSLNEDCNVGIKVTRMVMNCLHDCPNVRAEAKVLARALKDLKQEKNSAAQKRSCLEQEVSLPLEKKRQRIEE